MPSVILLISSTFFLFLVASTISIITFYVGFGFNFIHREQINSTSS
jgi:hypothetical protein